MHEENSTEESAFVNFNSEREEPSYDSVLNREALLGQEYSNPDNFY